MRKPEILPNALSTYIEQLPKVDLHVHLEGTIKPELVMLLAERNNVPLSPDVIAELQNFHKFRDFNHFIELFTIVTSCLVKPSDYSLIAYEFGKECARQHIIYAEVTFSMTTNCRLTGLPWHVILDALNEGREKAQHEFAIRWNWVFDIIRDEPSTQDTILNIAHESMAKGVIAIGLTGHEDSQQAQLFEATFAKAKSYGLGRVPHAGETSGAQAIWDALNYLQPTRIGHGIHCIDDSRLIEELKRKQIPLEICITSNVSLGAVADYVRHPIRQLWDAGLCITIASDDPALFNTDLTREYKLLETIYGFDAPMLEKVSLNGARASCLPEAEKAQLAETIASTSKQIRSSCPAVALSGEALA